VSRRRERVARGSVPLLVLLLAAAAPACSFLDWESFTRDTPRGGDGASADATPSPDGSGADGGVVAVADADAIVEEPPCAPDELCEFFEGSGTTLPNQVSSQGPATAVVDGVKPRSGKGALHLTKTGNGIAVARLNTNLADGVVIKGCTMDVFLDLDVAQVEIFAHYHHASPTAPYREYQALGIVYEANNSQVTEVLRVTGTADSYDNKRLLQLDTSLRKWTRLTTTLTPTASQVGIDGTPVDKAALYRPSTHEHETVLVGVNYENVATSRWEIFVDNLRCVVQ